MTRSVSTPLKQGPPPASMDPPATPGLRQSSSAPEVAALATPNARQQALPPATPGSSSTSPFPDRPPQTPGLTTPGGTATSCTSENSLFIIVKVHTAKCTECDKRNMDTMRRCPGCTFQVCKPCYERRERQGRGLMHGNLMSSVPTPTIQRTVRRKPMKTTDTLKATAVEKVKVTNEKVEPPTANGKGKQIIPSTPKRQAKKRGLKKKRDIRDTPTDSSSDDDFMPDSPSSIPSKRRRTALTSSSTATPKPLGTSTRVTRKLLPTSTMPNYRAPSLARSDATLNPEASAGVRVGDLDVDALMRTFGVNTAENPYQEHPLSRREPVMSNPVIEIPAIVKRGFQPRPSSEEIQRNLQENVLKHMEAKRKQAEEEARSHTARAFVEAEATKHQQQAKLDEEGKEALFDAMKVEARKWCIQTYGRLDLDTQKAVRRGLDMRLDMIDHNLKEQFALKMAACSAQKLKELEEESAHSAGLHMG